MPRSIDRSVRRRLLAAVFVASVLVPGLAAAQERAADPVPAIVEQLRLTNVETRQRGEGRGGYIFASLPDGTRVKVEFDRRGTIEEIEAEDRSAFPAGVVEHLIPPAVRNHASYPSDALFRQVEFDGDEIEIEGRWGDGRRFQAEFTRSGRLKELKIRE